MNKEIPDSERTIDDLMEEVKDCNEILSRFGINKVTIWQANRIKALEELIQVKIRKLIL